MPAAEGMEDKKEEDASAPEEQAEDAKQEEAPASEEEESQPEPAVSEGVPPEVRVLLFPRVLVAGC